MMFHRCQWCGVCTVESTKDFVFLAPCDISRDNTRECYCWRDEGSTLELVFANLFPDIVSIVSITRTCQDLTFVFALYHILPYNNTMRGGPRFCLRSLHTSSEEEEEDANWISPSSPTVMKGKDANSDGCSFNESAHPVVLVAAIAMPLLLLATSLWLMYRSNALKNSETFEASDGATVSEDKDLEGQSNELSNGMMDHDATVSEASN